MTLRTQLKNVKMQDSESIQSYFTRVSQLREYIEAIGDSVEEAELVMTTRMVCQDHGTHSSRASVLEGILRSSIDYGKIARKKKQDWKHVKKS